MTYLVELRTKLIQFAAKRERGILYILRFLMVFVTLSVINKQLGYQEILNHWWVPAIIAVICVFVHVRGVTMIIMFYGILQLMSLSTDVAVSAVVLLIVSYAACAYFQSKDTYHMVVIPVCYRIHIPFAMPISAGLLGGMNELPSVLFGAVVSYYLRTISVNASLFLEKDSEMTASMLIQNKLLTNPMFYIFIVTMSVVFVLVHYIRTSAIKYAWTIAVISATVLEFLVMLAGAMFADGSESIPLLIWGSIATLAIGLAMTFFARGADYSRTENVMFEDDDYFYYVKAVPKLHIADQEKEIKKITEGKE